MENTPTSPYRRVEEVVAPFDYRIKNFQEHPQVWQFTLVKGDKEFNCFLRDMTDPNLLEMSKFLGIVQ